MPTKNSLILAGSAILIFFVGLTGGYLFFGRGLPMGPHMNSPMNHGEERNKADGDEEIAKKVDRGVKKLLAEGKYKCCLSEPCSYCFEEGECDCLDNIMNGKHPCGECMGEILEGEGNPLLAEYFAAAIADEVGEEYKPALKQIIADKYGMPIEEQL